MFNRESFTVEEWAQIISVPASVGAMVVTADPSGPMGLIGEFRAIMNTMKDYVGAHAADSPFMTALQSYMTTKPTEEEEQQLKEWAQEQQETMKSQQPRTPEEMSALIHKNVDSTLDLMEAKGATHADLVSFKNMMFAVAEAVANASKEGGFLGFGGQRVSDAEQSVLAQIKAELGV